MLIFLFFTCNKDVATGKVVKAPPDSGGTTSIETVDSGRDTDTASDTASDTADTDDTVPVTTEGIDIAQFDIDIRWDEVRTSGISFVYSRATEGTYYESPEFDVQTSGAYAAGLYHGAYHFAVPNDSGGVDQALYFVDHGGDWTSDGQTLPGALDLEYNPYGEVCYSMTAAELADWIESFIEAYKGLTGRDVVIYTTQDWWDSCVGEVGFSNPLWLAEYDVATPTLPKGWSSYQFWQYDSRGSVAGIDGDTNVDHFNGSVDELIAFVNGE